MKDSLSRTFSLNSKLVYEKKKKNEFSMLNIDFLQEVGEIKDRPTSEIQGITNFQ